MCLQKMAELVKLNDPPSTSGSPVWRHFGFKDVNRNVTFFGKTDTNASSLTVKKNGCKWILNG